MTSDSTLRADIEAELEFEPSLNAASIGVAVKDGVATLTGHVASYAEKIAAERAVSRVKGVRAIAEEIEVRLPFEVKKDDGEIARRVANELNWSASLPADAVRSKVENGWVTLNGEVDWQYQKEEAAAGLRRLSGIVGVTNLIKIRPHPTAADVSEQISRAYRRNAQIDASGIKVVVSGGRVTLSGRVKAWHERREAEKAAWAISGVTEVVDNLFVS